MEYFKFSNPHPHGKLVKDCVKRAIVHATGKDYMEVQRELNQIKKITGAEKFNEKKNDRYYIENILKGKIVKCPVHKGEPRMNGRRFCEEYPEGTYILQMAGHLTCCIDGVIYDTWDCTEKCVYKAWRIN